MNVLEPKDQLDALILSAMKDLTMRDSLNRQNAWQTQAKDHANLLADHYTDVSPYDILKSGYDIARLYLSPDAVEPSR